MALYPYVKVYGPATGLNAQVVFSTLQSFLADISEFLKSAPNEIVWIMDEGSITFTSLFEFALESHQIANIYSSFSFVCAIVIYNYSLNAWTGDATVADVGRIYQDAFAAVTKLYEIPAAVIAGQQAWPSYNELLANNTRLIVLMASQSQPAGRGQGINSLYNQGIIVNGPYLFTTSSDFSSQLFANLTVNNSSLFIFNHFFYTDARPIFNKVLQQLAFLNLVVPSDYQLLLSMLPSSMLMADYTKVLYNFMSPIH